MNAKKKGNHMENVWANWLIKNGIKAWKDGASGGGTNEKGDVGNNLNLHMEVKAVKGINLQKVWKKALHECEKTHNLPLLAIHFDGMGEEEFLVVIDNGHWLDLMTKEQGVETNYQDPKLKWAIQGSIEANKKLLKLIEI